MLSSSPELKFHQSFPTVYLMGFTLSDVATPPHSPVGLWPLIRTVSLMFLKNQGGNENLDACREAFHDNETVGNEGVRTCQIIF